MARNRKNQSAAIRLEPVLKTCLICGVIVVCCVGYVWQKKQISELGEQIRQRETGLAKSRDQNEKLKRQLAMLLSPQYLDARVKELKLGLVPPQPAQIWRLPEPFAEPVKQKRDLELAVGFTPAPGQ
jgi:cell division protein FtsL